MTLDLDDIITTKEWSEIRKTQKEKYQNITHLETFNKCLYKMKNDFNGNIGYSYRCSGEKDLFYCENTPIFHFFKFSPKKYFMEKEDVFNLWKKSDTDGNIIDKFESFNTNKYKQPNQTIDIEYDKFILFPLQSMFEKFNTEIFYDCVKWAVKNEKNIVFKLHTFHTNDNSIQKAIDNVCVYPKVKKYVKFVGNEYNIDNLIDQCEMVWIFNSGAGLQALLKGKSVSYFMKPFEYYPMCKYAKTPEEAYDGKYDLDTVKKFLSWYYHKLIIDSTSSNFEEKMHDRLDKVLNKNLTIHDIY